jgi:hypothetical protein
MSAQPAEHLDDPLDPQRILRELPDRERANFSPPTGKLWTVREIQPGGGSCGASCGSGAEW